LLILDSVIAIGGVLKLNGDDDNNDDDDDDDDDDED